jgi:23S rRNA pseudouridine955/2504/2580 synthase
LSSGDSIRLPPIYPPSESLGVSSGQAGSIVPPLKSISILYEDDFIMVLNKPSGLAVHAGSGVHYGLIEQLRVSRPDLKFIELAHRLDRETSGILLLAKKRQILVSLHAMFRGKNLIKKRYLALCLGFWPDQVKDVQLPLSKHISEKVGKKMYVDHEHGQYARTLFRVIRRLGHDYTLVEAELKTGRTHQIRIHMAETNCPIAGDARYGRFDVNKGLVRLGVKRMFLHAHGLEFAHPMTQERLSFELPLPRDLLKALNLLSQESLN